jgi:NAD(P)H dehydrogenase (quinone)
VRVLLVHCHPNPGSFVSSLAADARRALELAGHDVRFVDLHADGFDPVFTLSERLNHTAPSERKLEEFPVLRASVEALLWCDALVFVYPTWWSGQPAMLKGWIDRVLMKGVAWDLPDGASTLVPGLTHVRRIVAVTTHGSSKFVNALEGEAGKRTITRALRLMCGLGCRTSWVAMYGLDRADERSRERFRRRVTRAMARLS